MSNIISMPQSLWAATAINAPVCQKLEGHIETQVVIIGAGFTGCSAALHLSEMGIDVVVLEAGEIGVGASGRNGGQVNPGIKRTVEHVQSIWGKEKGAELYTTIGSAPDLVFDLIKKHNIDCHPIRSGIVQAAYSRASLKYTEKYGEYQASTGADIRFLDRDQTKSLIGSDFYIGGFLDKRAGSVQPLSYCRGLAFAAMKAGAQIFIDSAVSTIAQSSEGKVLKTAHGQIKAKSVLVCTNGYTNLFPKDPLIKQLSKSIIPFYSYKVATKPLEKDLQNQFLPDNQIVADTRRLLTYFRKDHLGRLVMGGAGGPYAAKSARDYEPIVGRISQIFPQLAATEIEFKWCGKVCITPNHVPHIHELAADVYCGLGYNGRGVAMATLMGKWLSDLVGKKIPNDLSIPITTLRTIPAHGIRNPFIKGMLKINDFHDRLEKAISK